MSKDLASLDCTGQAELVRAGELSAADHALTRERAPATNDDSILPISERVIAIDDYPIVRCPEAMRPSRIRVAGRVVPLSSARVQYR